MTSWTSSPDPATGGIDDGVAFVVIAFVVVCVVVYGLPGRCR